MTTHRISIPGYDGIAGCHEKLPRVTFICALLTLFTLAADGSSAEFFEVVTVTPSRVIEHEVELKGPFDDSVIETQVIGPQLFSHAVGIEDGDARQQKAYLNWYKIAEHAKEPQRTLSIRSSLPGNQPQKITIENAAFLLSPTQRVTNGPPTPISETLGYFKAYKIVNALRSIEKVQLRDSFARQHRQLTQPAFLCVPVSHWHHAQHSPVKNQEGCLIVYELLPEEISLHLTTIDQFGLNKLTATSSQWLAVHATLLEEK
jgi:hypothetical protein